ncbi:MAG: bifunctional oligoribonuclease/PAP phosphatase NrnA [Bacteroides sp.]
MSMQNRVSEVVNPFSLARLNQLLQGIKRIAICCHARPDGDAIGSSLGLGNLLTTLGYEVLCVAPNRAPAHIAWPEGAKDLLYNFEEEGVDVKPFLASCDLLFCLDFNALSRLDEPMMLFVESLAVPRVMIDHHPHPASQFDLYFSMPESSSTCELLTELLLANWGQVAISQKVAIPLYMGLMTDTGSFSYSCSRKRTFEIAGILVEQGVDVPEVQARVYNSRTLDSLMLQSALILQYTTFFAGKAGKEKAAIVQLSQPVQEQYQYQPGDAEGLANLPLCVGSVQISVLLTERSNGTVRVSARSTKRYTINKLLAQFFNGGGHPQASGGTLRMPLHDAYEYTRRVLSQFLEKEAQQEEEVL